MPHCRCRGRPCEIFLWSRRSGGLIYKEFKMYQLTMEPIVCRHATELQLAPSVTFAMQLIPIT